MALVSNKSVTFLKTDVSLLLLVISETQVKAASKGKFLLEKNVTFRAKKFAQRTSALKFVQRTQVRCDI